MKILLTAINAKYIHSNLAVYSLRAYAARKRPRYANELEIAEYTINQTADSILMDLYEKKPDILCFSCYLWNIEYVRRLLLELPKIMPEIKIWLGGPEVSYHAERILEGLPSVNGIMCGEGEETFLELVRFYHGEIASLDEIAGIVYRENSGETGEMPHRVEGVEFARVVVGEAGTGTKSGHMDGTHGKRETAIRATGQRHVMNLSQVPFVYQNMDEFQHKIIYYESSRGCPFSCSYCLSSVDKKLRFRDLNLVKKELQFFIDNRVPQVKFVDRTFNCHHGHAMEIWSYLKEHDKGYTNFHFEVAADLLNEEEIELMQSLRPGLIQLEIGVQSTNERTIREIKRTMDFTKVAEVVKKIHAAGNVHQHLDLIAGLPFEDYESFRKSFNEVYTLYPEQLQLGFLKVLKGSYMEEKAEEYELQYQDAPPYEVISTKWLSYADVIRLKRIEEMVEVYYNSGQFAHTMKCLEDEFADAFSMYETLAAYYEERGYLTINHTRIARYEILYEFIMGRVADENVSKHEEVLAQGVDGRRSTFATEEGGLAGRFVRKAETFRQMLVYDLYLRENVKNRPVFAGSESVTKEEAMKFYDTEARERRYLNGYEQYDKRQLRKMTHLEWIEGKLLLFDYQNRDVLTNQAKVMEIEKIEGIEEIGGTEEILRAGIENTNANT